MFALGSARELENLRVVLVEPRNPLNIGAVARAMSNFGFSRLRLVSPYELAFREARSAVGASALMRAAEVFRSIPEAVKDCAVVVGTTAVRHRQLHHPLHQLKAASPMLLGELAQAPVALLFGSEKFGLSTEDLSYCHWLLRIPTRDEHISMNLGQAVAICLYELIRGRKGTKRLGVEKSSATMEEIDRLTEVFTGLLHASGYIKQRTVASSEEKVRRLIRRMKLNGRDAELMLGMLRKVEWKLRSRSEP
jgi:tRNA/rRNA methyltransferase